MLEGSMRGDRPQGGSQGGFARSASQGGYGQGSKDDDVAPAGFSAIDEDIPF